MGDGRVRMEGDQSGRGGERAGIIDEMNLFRGELPSHRVVHRDRRTVVDQPDRLEPSDLQRIDHCRSFKLAKPAGNGDDGVGDTFAGEVLGELLGVCELHPDQLLDRPGLPGRRRGEGEGVSGGVGGEDGWEEGGRVGGVESAEVGFQVGERIQWESPRLRGKPI